MTSKLQISIAAVFATFVPVALFGWTSGGPPLRFADEVAGVATDPTNPNVVYASDGNGFFRSDDAGGSWTQLSTTSLTHVLAVDPSNPMILYAGKLYGGIVRSTDGGRSWDSVNSGLTCPSVTWLAVSISSPNVVYAASENPSHTEQQCGGVFRSDDSAEHWRSLTGALVDFIAVDPSSPDIAYTTSSYPVAGAMRTEDGGKSWTLLAFQPVTGTLAIDPSNPAHLYAVGLPADARCCPPPAVCESRGRGDSWEILAAPPGQVFSFLVVDPANPNVVFAASSGNEVGGGVFRSGDGGYSWVSFGLAGEPVAALAIDRKGESLHASVAGKGIFDQPISRPEILPISLAGPSLPRLRRSPEPR